MSDQSYNSTPDSASVPTSNAAPAAVPGAQPGAPKSKGKKKVLIFTALGALAVLALVVFVAVPEMNRASAYDQAESQMMSEQYEEASAAFANLGNYRDATAQVRECQNYLDYNEAKSLMEAGNFEAAHQSFKELGKFQDAREFSNTCYGENLCSQAEEQLAQGNNYQAYKTFQSAKDTVDVAERAQACIVSMPETGELFRNSDYGGNDCEITIASPADLDTASYMKIERDGQVVSTVFMAPGEGSVELWLPAGSYSFKLAGGKDWFGENDLFGDEGYYNKNPFSTSGFPSSGEESTMDLETGYGYSLKLEKQLFSFGGVGSGRSSF